MSNQDPFPPPAGYPTTPPPTGYPTAPPPYAGGTYDAPPPYQGHPAFAPYGSAAPQYGAPPAPGYPAYGTPPSSPPVGYPAYGYQPVPYGGAPTYAHWGLRVGALLIDLLAYLPYWIGAFLSGFLSTPAYDQYGQPTTLSTPAGQGAFVVGGLVSLGLWVWNRGVLQARTGQSLGKKLVGLRLAREATGENVGVVRALLRDLAHWFDCWLLGLGFWFPLWDAKRQTFADKMAKTVSVR